MGAELHQFTLTLTLAGIGAIIDPYSTTAEQSHLVEPTTSRNTLLVSHLMFDRTGVVQHSANPQQIHLPVRPHPVQAATDVSRCKAWRSFRSLDRVSRALKLLCVRSREGTESPTSSLQWDRFILLKTLRCYSEAHPRDGAE
ncbi:hypothetical protein Bbelb_373420 [Branchiostoma belcheri]|nr:hypothetical protein Bbelb_373420 [Branchiostoma belcheri]